MTDFDRFLVSAREHAAHIHRIADRLLAEGKIGIGTRDALTGAARDLLRDAYQAGRSEPTGVADLFVELERVAHTT